MRALYQELRRRRKHARIIGVGLSVALLLLATLVIIVLISLPSMQTLRANYFSSRLRKPVTAARLAQTTATLSGTTQSAPPAQSVRSMPTPQSARAAGSPPADARSAGAPRNASADVASLPTLADYVTERFIDRGDRSLDVCRSLVNLRGQAPSDVTSFTQALRSQIEGPQTNPFADAALVPLAAVLQLPSVAAVVTQIRDAQDSGDLSLLKRAQFYSSVAFAASDVYANQARIDRVSDHAYHLSVLARIAALVPGSAGDSTFQNLCVAIEARALSPAVVTNQDVANEKAALLQLAGTMGLTPQQAKFDPQLSTHVSVQVAPTQVTLSTPWMTKLYGSGLQLSANTAR